ncbi:Spy0128 family protein [Streptococcus parasanguinis]|uniref:Spy0128 family protein n=1 Tax=Streptococcus parasanguinis TaxID=1318 RepID=UPI0021504F7C|nr:FctA domain-containing protein [Streptococcus parasanguinis]MCR4487476.1 SpaA isopeptide-forming pilin-related protein [Streptococcus parasanguinis]
MKFLYKKIVAFVAIIAVVALGLSVIKPVSAATVSPTVTNLKAQASGQKVIFSFDWDLTGKSVKEGDTFTIDAPEGVNITEVATQSLQANGAEVATISMTNKKITFTFKKAIESMNQNVKGGFSYKAEWDNTPGNPGNKTATSKVGSESVVITRPDGPGVFEAILNKYNRTGDYVSKQFKLDASENYAWMNVGDDYYLTTWFIRINGDGKKQAITNPVVSDKIQAPAVDYSKITFAPAANHAASEFFVGTYLKPSFTLRKGGQVVASGWDFWKHVKFDADGNGFTVNLSDVSDVFKTASSDELIVEYQTLIPKTTVRVDNNATLTADEIKTPLKDPAFWNNTELNFWVSGDKTITVQKEWVGDEEADRKDITVQLLADGKKLDGMTKTLTKASGWTAEFSKLPGIKDGQPIVYSVEETNTPDGYTSKVEPINESNVIKVVNTSNKPKVTETTANLVVKKAFEVAGDQEHTQLPITEGQFEFVLKEGNNTLETAKNKANGTVTFKELSYTAEGTHTYTITENKGTDASINYSTQTITATVEVKKVNDKLVATVTYSGGDTEKGDTFTNTKTPPAPVPPTVKPTTAQFKAKKVLAINGSSDRTLKANEFTFLLKDQAGTLVDTKTNGENGDILFNPVTFNEAGTFTYTITEQKPATPESAITYDESVHFVTVTVTKDENGQLNADVQYDGKKDTPTFTNTYTPPTPVPPTVKPTTAQFKAKKVLAINGSSDRTLKANEFTFLLKDQAGTLVDTKTNGENGDILFNPVTFNEAGTFTYTITEQKPATPESAITYDESVHTVTVTVTKDANGQLNADVQYDGKKNIPTFTNTYTPPTPPTPSEKQITTSKILEGRDLQGGEFSFNLLDENGTVLQTKQNAADGTVTFDAIAYTEAMIGTHKYTIKEVLPADQANIQYDEGQVDVTVTVTKDEASNAIQAVVSYGAKKTFINKVIPPTPPTVNNPELKLYTLRVRKVDEKGDYLAGAVFGLFEADGVTPVANPYGQGQAQAISGQDGLASFVGFEAKEYVIKELSAPSGYQLSDTTIKVSASDFASATNLVVDKGNVVNKLLPPPPSTDKPYIPTTSTSKPKTPSSNGDKPKPGDKPKSSETPKSSDKPKEGKRSLPSTGTEDHLGLLVTGMTFVATAIASLKLKKKEDF